MHWIDTPEQYDTIRKALTPPVLKSGRRAITVPCTHTLLVSRALIRANNYNPNSVDAGKMRLLRQSILDNGFCFPVVTIWDDAERVFVIIDGFHRFTIAGPDWLNLTHAPAVVLTHDISKRMYATVQFNKARGVHQVDLDADLIRALIQQGNSEEEIAKHLGMDLDTVYRYKQLTGIADLFATANWSMPWTVMEEASDHG